MFVTSAVLALAWHRRVGWGATPGLRTNRRISRRNPPTTGGRGGGSPGAPGDVGRHVRGAGRLAAAQPAGRSGFTATMARSISCERMAVLFAVLADRRVAGVANVTW